MICKHCNYRRAQLDGRKNPSLRGLCKACHASPKILALYPVVSLEECNRRRAALSKGERCRHCKWRKSEGLSHGLCRPCCKDPAARALYPNVKHVPDRERWTVCRHCTKKRPNRPRGLCWSCYYTPGVRDRYASTSKYSPVLPDRGYPDARAEDGLTPPAEPTDHPPGSPGKIEVLTRRFADRTSLWHPDDFRPTLNPPVRMERDR